MLATASRHRIDPMALQDPFRSAQWRWSRVLQIVDHKPRALRCRTTDDDFIRTAREFILRHRAHTSHLRQRELWADFPGMYGAYQIFTTQKLKRRDLIEARILAEQEPKDIATHTGAMPDAIYWYEKVFFNVLDRIRVTDWIISEVLAPHALVQGANWEGNESAMTLKFFAWAGGPRLLDFMITMANRGFRPESYDQCLEWTDANFAHTLKARALMAARCTKLQDWSVPDFLAIQSRMLELQNATDSGQQSKNYLEQGLKAMLEVMPFRVGRAGAAEVDGTPIGAIDSLSVEARDSELYFLATQEGPPNGLADFGEYEIPEYTDHEPPGVQEGKEANVDAA